MSVSTRQEAKEQRKWDLEEGVRTAKNFAKLKNDKSLWPAVKKELQKEIEVATSEFDLGQPSKK